MATTSAPLPMPFSMGSSSFMGQGTSPELLLMYTTDPASTSIPTWVTATLKCRSFNVSRGRSSELERVGAGTATIVMDNRDRALDPVNNPAVKPMNRWWVREQFTGETQDIFFGYADAYEQQWPAAAGLADQLAVVHCTDELAVLAAAALPLLDPPVKSGFRSDPKGGTPATTYSDMVKTDEPTNYWRFADFNNLSGDPGSSWTVGSSGGYSIANASGVLGDYLGSGESGASGSLFMNTSSDLLQGDPDMFDTQARTEMTVEFWFRYSAVPGADSEFVSGRVNAANTQRNIRFLLLTTGAVRFTATNTVPTQTSITSGVLVPNTWYHIAGRVDGSFIKIYVNGVEVASTAWTGTIITNEGDLHATSNPLLQGIGSITYNLDELAFYNRSLGAARIAAHYTAGASRGFPAQLPGDRMGAVLDAVSSHASRNIFSGSRTMQPTFMAGQSPLEECRNAEAAEAVDAVFFVARDGDVVFLPDGYRLVSPYDTVQATFDDDGTDLPYTGLELDYSLSFLANKWSVIRSGGTMQIASDATSITNYFERPQSLTIPVTQNSMALDVANAMLAKYKDPITRVQEIRLTAAVPAVAEAVFRRDIGDRIRIFRTPIGGGTRIDQTVFIQSVKVEANAKSPGWAVTWGVSPL